MTQFKYRQLLLSGLTLSLLQSAPMAMAVETPSTPALIDSGSFARDTSVNLERISLPGQETEAAKSSQAVVSESSKKSENSDATDKPVEASASFTEEAPRAIAQSAPQRDSDIV
ncbi:MAG: hypothetical protein C0508_09775, partial [Cyanobacteria bacterium PR.023]|nr:hypothetical protein [Cyanobacteria bacterium PR.023]